AATPAYIQCRREPRPDQPPRREPAQDQQRFVPAGPRQQDRLRALKEDLVVVYVHEPAPDRASVCERRCRNCVPERATIHRCPTQTIMTQNRRPALRRTLPR